MAWQDFFKEIHSTRQKEECEAKLKVTNLEDLLHRIEQLHPQKQETYHERNELYKKDGVTFRLRKTREKTTILLTYKGGKLPSLYKKRPEHEAEISEDEAEKITKKATYLGKYDRKRIIYFLGSEQYVMLDYMDALGPYVEIEAPNDEKVTSLIRQLGLNEKKHINDSYFALIQKKNEASYNK